MPCGPDDEVVIAAFYAAARGEIEWGQALSLAVTALDLLVSHLFAIDLSSGEVLFSFEAGDGPAEAMFEYIRHYHRIDPRTGLVLSLPVGQWMHCHEHFDDAFVAADPFYQEWLLPAGGRWVSGIKLEDEESVAVIWGLNRGPDKSPLPETGRRRAERFGHHLAQAIRLYRRSRSRVAAIRLGEAVLERIPTPVILVDEQRAIRFANPPGRRVLDTADSICDRHGYLGCVSRSDEVQLNLALRALGLAEGSVLAGSTPEDRQFLRLGEGAEMAATHLLLYAIRPKETLGAFGRSALALVVPYRSDGRLCVDPLVLSTAYDLTPAECQIAVCVAQGMSIEDIVEARQVSRSTVTSQLKSLYAKLGVSRQAELVSALSALPFAGNAPHAVA